MSEILLDLNADYKELNNYINDSGFENAAIKYSISDTSTNGGKIGWVKSSNLSEFIKNQIYNLKEGDISKPIEISNGRLILKLNSREKLNLNLILMKK